MNLPDIDICGVRVSYASYRLIALTVWASVMTTTAAKVRRPARLRDSGQTTIRNCMRRRQHRRTYTTDLVHAHRDLALNNDEPLDMHGIDSRIWLVKVNRCPVTHCHDKPN